MVSGPVFLTALEGEGGPLRLREVVGATDPAQAAEGTVRKRFGLDKGRNSVHASDSETSAERETSFFFPASFPRFVLRRLWTGPFLNLTTCSR
jgi:nucleoside-diphosphate kinase